MKVDDLISPLLADQAEDRSLPRFDAVLDKHAKTIVELYPRLSSIHSMGKSFFTNFSEISVFMMIISYDFASEEAND